MKNGYNLAGLFLILFILLPDVSFSRHLVGGEVSYTCVGNNNYAVKFTIYRDCRTPSGAAFDNPLRGTIFEGSRNFLNFRIPLTRFKNLPITSVDTCVKFPNNLCLQKAVYRDTFYLPPSADGYTISHQRCCRNSTITNVPLPDDWGNTYTISIPPNDVGCNSSPIFNFEPPIVLCLNEKVEIDNSVSEADGDSVYYSLCSALHGAGNSQDPADIGGFNSPRPDSAAGPPYTKVPFSSGFSATYPITSQPRFTINHQTGIIEGRPTAVGQYVFAVCASEYRNGVLISTNRRDFQFNVSANCQSTISLIKDQMLIPDNICSGKNIEFESISENTSTVYWDFGDLTTLSDTSRNRRPNYFYPDTGVYNVMLVANPYTACADTSFKDFYVYDSTNVRFTASGDLCFESNSINFSTSGHYTSKATFEWDFNGLTANHNQSTEEAPQGVRFTSPGTHRVSVRVTDGFCSRTYWDEITIYPNPQLIDEVPRTIACAPVTVDFADNSTAATAIAHYWTFGDGFVSTDPGPTHTYYEPGLYTVTHTIKTSTGCRDSARSVRRDIIEVLPVPQSRFNLSQNQTSIYTPIIDFTDEASGATRTETRISDGRVFNDVREKSIEFSDTGSYIIEHISYNQFGCSDTLSDSVYVGTPFNLFIPNAFSPNDDGINDYFSFTVTNVRGAHLQIYDRWGTLQFESNELDARWDGRDKNGEVLQGGIYPYVLKLQVKDNGYTHTEMGSIKLLR